MALRPIRVPSRGTSVGAQTEPVANTANQHIEPPRDFNRSPACSRLEARLCWAYSQKLGGVSLIRRAPDHAVEAPGQSPPQSKTRGQDPAFRTTIGRQGYRPVAIERVVRRSSYMKLVRLIIMSYGAREIAVPGAAALPAERRDLRKVSVSRFRWRIANSPGARSWRQPPNPQALHLQPAYSAYLSRLQQPASTRPQRRPTPRPS